MIKIADLIGALNDYQETKRRLDECRHKAVGDVEYYCSDFRQKHECAEQELSNALNGYIDQRVAEDMARVTTVTPPARVGAVGALR
jgi:hypothetical protein